MATRKDVIGEVYGRLIITADAENQNGHRRVIVNCECGVVKEIFLTVLRCGDAISCGCYHKEGSSTHGETRTPLYAAWSAMKDRCSNSNHQFWMEYGGRGITVCNDWLESYISFRDWANQAGYKKGLTLDREDNMANYSPDNCQWVNRVAQQRNRRSVKGSSSQYVGVSFVNRHKKWIASVKHDGKSVNLGLKTSELEAAITRDQYIIDNNLTNFTMNGVLT